MLRFVWGRLILGAMLLALCGAVSVAQDTVTYEVELYTTANYPVTLAFDPEGRLFYNEKTTGNVRVMSAEGVLQPEPVITFAVSALAERGMLGIAIDPQYAENGHIWVFYTAEATARDYPANQIVRFTFDGETGLGHDPEIMLSIPITNGNLIHNGGNLHFDADGLLYVTIGDYEDAANSQDLTTMPGKIHRFAVTDEGLIPAPDNPFEDSSIYAYGLRNSFDFAFDTQSPHLFATENGLHCDDEINLILPGFNYGAGAGYVCGDAAPNIDRVMYLPGLLSFTPTEAPTAIIVYDHPAVPAWQDKLFFCAWNAGVPLRMVTLDEKRQRVVSVDELPLPDDIQCRIDLAVGVLDGALYFSTVGADGGAIYRIVPQMR